MPLASKNAKNEQTFKLTDRIGLWATRAGVALFSLLPFAWLYALSDGLAFLLYRVAGYRRRVVLDNLRRSFPEKTEAERRQIAGRFYRNLCDVLLESLKGNTMTADQLRERVVGDGMELLAEGVRQGRPIIAMGSHYNNWEWVSLAVKLHLPDTCVIGVYKPLKNPGTDAYLSRRRGRFGLELVSMERSGYLMLRYRERPCVFSLIADQTPSNTRTAHWLEFLHQETPFLPGGDKLARRLDLPVYYFHLSRRARGRYCIHISLLAERAGQLREGEVTRRFARRLEAAIRAEPANWLWSHRRWKHDRPERVALLSPSPQESGS